MKHGNYAWAVNAAGWGIIVIALVFVVLQAVGRANGRPYDPAENIAIATVAALGISVSVIARCLKKIEARLAKLERNARTQTYIS